MKTTGSADARLASALEAARKAPERDGHWNEVEHLAASLQKPDDVAALYREVLATSLSPEEKTRIGLRAVRFHDEWFGGEDSPALLELLGRVLEASPAEETALSRISMALTVGGRWDELLGVYDRAIEASDGGRRARLLEEALQVAKDFAAQPDRAIGYMQQLIPLRRGDTMLADSLERMLERQERWVDLIALWKLRAADMPPADARAARARAAECWLDRQGDAASALAEVESLLPASDDDAAACPLLERILAGESAPRQVRMAALTSLRARYQRHERHDEVARVLELGLGIAEGDAELELRRELAARLPALGREVEAVAHLSALLGRRPNDVDAHRRLAELTERTGEHARYLEALLAAADVEGIDAARAMALVAEAGELSAGPLHDATRAIDLFARVLADERAPRELAWRVARRQSALLGAAGRSAERLDVLERLAALEHEPVVQTDLLGRAARLADELGQTDRAIGLWRALLARDPADLEAMDALGELLAREARWPALVELLRKRRDAPGARRDRRADLARLAQLQAVELGDVDAAVTSWTELAEEFGEDNEVVDALANLYQRAERWNDLGALLARAEGRETQHLGAVLVSLGDALREHLEDRDGALVAYRRVLQSDPSNARALEGLRALADGPTRAGAVDALAAAFAATRDVAALDELLEARLATRATDPERVRVLREHAMSAEARGDIAAALASLARAVPLSPHDVQIERDVLRLAGAARGAGEPTPAEAAARGIASAAFRKGAAAAEAVGAILRAGALYRLAGDLDERRGALDGALESYLDAARVVPEATMAASALVRVAARAGRWNDAARVTLGSAAARRQLDESLLADVEAAAAVDGGRGWTAAASAFEEASARIELPDVIAHAMEVRVAQWHDTRRGDLVAAEAAWARALARDPQSLPALEALVDVRRRLHAHKNDAASAKALFELLVELADRRPRDLGPLREAAELARAAGSPTLASSTRATLRRLFDDAARLWRAGEQADGEQLAPQTCSWAAEQLLGVLTTAGAHAAAVELLLEAARLPVEPEVSREHIHRAAELAADKLCDSARAVELYRGILRQAADDARAIERLGAILEREERLPELLALRRHELGLTDRGERRLELRLAIARIVGTIEERGGRVEALRQNLEERPGHEPSVAEVCRVLDAKGQHAQLADLLTDQARRVEGPARASRPPGAAARAAELWARVAVLAEVDLGDVERALEAHRRVVTLAPTPESLDALARLHEARGEHAAAARWLERRLEGTPAEERVSIALKLARAHVAAGQQGRAITWLERTLPRHPEANELRTLLADLYRGAEAWAPLAKLLYEGCEHVPDGESLLAMAREAAALYHDRLGTPERAIPLLEQVIKIVPEDRWVRLALADGLRAAERYPEARELLEGVISDYGRRRSAERASVHLELARVLRAEGRLGEALAQLDLASSMKVGDATVLATLGDVAREAGQLDRAEQAYRALLLMVRRAQGDLDPDAVGASEVLFALSRISVGQGNAGQADELRDSALAAASSNAVEARRFRRAALAAGEPQLAVRALELRLAAESDPGPRADLLAALAEVLEGPLDRADDALNARLDALDGAPDSLPLHLATRGLAKRLQRTDRYLQRVTELAEKRRRAEEAPVVSQLYLRLGEALEQDEGDLARAAEVFGRVEAMGQHAVEAKKALARVAGMRGVSADERRRLEEIVALDDAPADAKVDALYRLADIDVVGPENRARGLAALEDALERDPQYARAAATLREAAAGAPDDADLWALFERVSRVCGDDELLLDYVERRARHPAVSLDELREAVTLAARRSPDREQALLERTVERAREHPRGLIEALWAPEALAERCRLAGDTVGAVRWLREAAAAAEGETHRALALRAAELASQSDDQLDVAAELYEQLLEHGDTAREVWEPLLKVYRRIGDAQRLATLVTATVETLSTPAERNALRVEHANWLLEQAKGPLAARRGDAIGLLRDVLGESPDHAEAAAKLTSLYEQAGEVDALAELLSQQLDHARDRQDAAAAVTISLRAAEVLRGTRPEDAKDMLRAALEWAPRDRTVLARLLDSLRGDGEARERAERMEQLLALETGEAAGKMSRELAAAWEALDEPSGVQRALEAGYRGAPADGELRERLERCYRDGEDWASLAGLLVREAAREDRPREAVSRYREAAALYRDRVGDPESAAEALRRAVAQAPDDLELVKELIAVRGADSDPRSAIDELGVALTRLGDDPRALELYKLRADMLTEIGREDQAVQDLERAFSLGGAAEAPRLVAALQRWRDRAGRGGDLAAERAATMRLVEVLLAARDSEGARDALIGWVAADPTDRDALRALRDMDDAAGRWAEVAESCRRLIGLEQGSERIDAALRLADACTRAGDPAAARSGLEQAYAADPSVMLRNQLRKLYETIGAHRERAEMMLADAEGVGDESGRFALLVQAGELLLNGARDPAEALGPLRAALALKPDDPEAMLLLVDACIVGGLLEEATKRLDAAISAQGRRRTPELAMMQHRMARVADAYGDTRRQRDWLIASVDTDRNNGDAAADLADLSIKLGDHETALKALRVVTLLKTPCRMSRAMAFLRQAQIAHRQGDGQKALVFARRARAEDAHLAEANEFLRQIGDA